MNTHQTIMKILFIFIHLYQALCANVTMDVSAQLPAGVIRDVRHQIMLDFNNITGARIDGLSVRLPHAYMNVDALQGMMQQQSARESALYKVQDIVVNAQEKQESLNRRLRSGEYTDEFLYDYAQGSGAQTEQVVGNVTQAMQPYTAILRHSIGNFLLAPYLTSVTTGSNLYSIAFGAAKQNDVATKNKVYDMTSHYTALANLGMQASLNYMELQANTANILKELRL